MTNESRRDFLGAAPLAATALLAGAAVTHAEDTVPLRRAVGGSPYPTFSRAVVFGRIAFVAGVVGQKPGTRDLAGADFESQARQSMENLKASVEAAGAAMANVLKCTVFLTDAADFAAFNKIYVTYFPADPPARSTVVVKELVVPGAKLEIDCVASL